MRLEILVKKQRGSHVLETLSCQKTRLQVCADMLILVGFAGSIRCSS